MSNAKPFSPEDSAALAGAVELLESPGIFIRTVNLVGAPVEYVLKKLPKAAQEKINQATNMALQGALVMAVKTLNPKHHGTSSDWMHKIIVMATGGAGGFFGLAGLPVELPLSTGIMLRSIADIARSEGENLEDVKVRLACLEVFALGGSSFQDDASETSYYMTRAALARTLSEAAEFIAEKGIVEEGAPALVRLIAKIAERFGIQVSEKVAAEWIPVLGAGSGAVINYCFINHFQDMARGHFIVRRLERAYDSEFVKSEYEKHKKNLIKK